jgi:ankyrin repeat protein
MAATTPDMLALISAAQAKDTAKAEALLASGIPPNVKGSDSRTPLMHSCRLQDAATAQVLLSYGADPNLRNSFGYSPLGTVATLGALPLISLLVDNKPPADLESRTAEGMTPLLLAAQGGHVEAVKLLVKYGADIEARGRDGRGAIHWFARQSLHEGVEWLIKDGKADTELRNRDGYTAINTAAALGDLEMGGCLELIL